MHCLPAFALVLLVCAVVAYFMFLISFHVIYTRPCEARLRCKCDFHIDYRARLPLRGQQYDSYQREYKEYNLIFPLLLQRLEQPFHSSWEQGDLDAILRYS